MGLVLAIWMSGWNNFPRSAVARFIQWSGEYGPTSDVRAAAEKGIVANRNF